MHIFNSLTKKIEEFRPIKQDKVGVYTCGPTVYNYVTIGNWRTYTLGDILIRTLKYLNYNVQYVMNITDVGHLTGDNLGDASSGEDRLEKASKKENKSAWDIAKFYADDFLSGLKRLNFIQPDVLPKATDHIQEQIKIVLQIKQKGYAYKISDGIYFDVKKYEEDGNIYGQLSSLDKIIEGARVEFSPEKKDKRDFALWKFSPDNEKRQMEWDSPWGKGFPGWHIECSAMSMKYLGQSFDIHLGGEDLRSTHHPNEIAQSECATGKRPFVKYWMHGAFLQVDGGRMGKSLGNAYTLHDIEKKGFNSIHLRYFYLMGHYRKSLNFTWEALSSARDAYIKLKNLVKIFVRDLSDDEIFKGIVSKNDLFDSLSKGSLSKSALLEDIFSKAEMQSFNVLKERFQSLLENDLDTPKVLAHLWTVIRDKDLSTKVKFFLLKDFENVLGLNLFEVDSTDKEVPEEIIKLAEERKKAKEAKNYKRADELRSIIMGKGYVIKDEKGGYEVVKG